MSAYPVYELEKTSIFETLLNNIFCTRSFPFAISTADFQGEIYYKGKHIAEKYKAYASILFGSTPCFLAFNEYDFIYQHKIFENVEKDKELNLPLELKQAIFESLLEPYLNYLSTSFGVSISIQDTFLADESLPQEEMQVFLENLTGSENTHAKFAFKYLSKPEQQNFVVNFDVLLPLTMESESLIAKLNSLPSFQNSRINISDIEIPFEFSFESGYSILNKKEILDLENGDIILADEYYTSKDGCKLKLVVNFNYNTDNSISYLFQENRDKIGNFAFTFCTLTGQNAVVLHNLQFHASNKSLLKEDGSKMEENAENTGNLNVDEQNLGSEESPQENVPEQKTEAIAFETIINEFEAVLSFELERRVLTLNDIQGITPGYTFALACDKNSPITLRVNGKAIGRGRMVEMDGMLGVQVTHIETKK